MFWEVCPLHGLLTVCLSLCSRAPSGAPREPQKCPPAPPPSRGLEQVWSRYEPAKIFQQHLGPCVFGIAQWLPHGSFLPRPLDLLCYFSIASAKTFPLPSGISEMPFDMLTDIVIFAKAICTRCAPFQLLLSPEMITYPLEDFPSSHVDCCL